MMTPEQINTIIATQKKNDENFSAKDISDTEVYYALYALAHTL